MKRIAGEKNHKTTALEYPPLEEIHPWLANVAAGTVAAHLRSLRTTIARRKDFRSD